jgi:hypothetical protein
MVTVLPILQAPHKIIARMVRLANCPNIIKRKVVAEDAVCDQVEVST